MSVETRPWTPAHCLKDEKENQCLQVMRITHLQRVMDANVEFNFVDGFLIVTEFLSDLKICPTDQKGLVAKVTFAQTSQPPEAVVIYGNITIIIIIINIIIVILPSLSKTLKTASISDCVISPLLSLSILPKMVLMSASVMVVGISWVSNKIVRSLHQEKRKSSRKLRSQCLVRVGESCK